MSTFSSGLSGHRSLLLVTDGSPSPNDPPHPAQTTPRPVVQNWTRRYRTGVTVYQYMYTF